jgi:hypothetical protein
MSIEGRKLEHAVGGDEAVNVRHDGDLEGEAEALDGEEGVPCGHGVKNGEGDDGDV